MVKEFKIYIIANSITDSRSMSGGDKNFIENARRWLDWGQKVGIVTVPEGKIMCQKASLKAEFLILPTIKVKHFGIFLTYLYRIIFGSLELRKKIKSKTILYSSSDLLTDILPPLLIKLKYPHSFWAVSLNLIIPNPLKGYEKVYTNGYKLPRISDSLNFISQRLSLLITKKWADKIICTNRLYADYLINKGFKKNKVIIISRGMDLAEIKKVPKPKKNVFDGVFLGRFHPQKGLFDLVKIWARVVKRKPKAKLAVIGKGPEGITQEFKEKVKEKGLETNIKLLGFKEGEEKIKILKSSKVFLFPSLYESWGQVAGEAMACGLPVVAYNLPIYKNIFGQVMLKSKIGDEKQFSSLVLKLLEDDQFYHQGAKESETWIQRFDRSKPAKDVLEVLTS